MPSRVHGLMVLVCWFLLGSTGWGAMFQEGSQKPAVVAGEQPDCLKVLNWNVLYGFNHGKSVQEGVRSIHGQAPDVVALQELNGNTSDSLKKKAVDWGHSHSVILKERGFPVGLTSNAPIEVIEKKVEGFHHGYLHCKTHGIHFFVVHFWPGKDHEADAIIKRIEPLLQNGESVIVLGDFNTHSRNDTSFLAERENVKPLYEVVDLFESKEFVDLTYKHDKQAKFSCPSPITIPKWSASLEVLKSKRQRIDFIFADSRLQKHSVSGTVLVSEELDKISDHYPVVAEFEFPALDDELP